MTDKREHRSVWVAPDGCQFHEVAGGFDRMPRADDERPYSREWIEDHCGPLVEHVLVRRDEFDSQQAEIERLREEAKQARKTERFLRDQIAHLRSQNGYRGPL